MQATVQQDDEGIVSEERWRRVDEPRHADARKLMAFWKARPPDGIQMGRDVPSRQIASLLSRIMIWEPLPDRSDMRARLAGASYLKRFDSDIKGRLMSELFPPGDFQTCLQGMVRTLDEGEAVILDTHLSVRDVDKMHMEIVVFPVVAPDHKSKWLLVGIFYFD